MQQQSLFEPASNMQLYAHISDCERYRYTLGRMWDEKLPACLFIMLNPSTADASQDDPTIRRCVAFAKSWSCGAIWVMNLFAFRATKPADLHRAAKGGIDIVGPNNDTISLAASTYSITGPIVFAWGNNGLRYSDRVRHVTAIYPQAQCLGITKSGAPQHPLFVPGNTPLQSFHQI